MKSILLLTLSLISTQALAGNIQCVLQEFDDQVNIQQEMILEKSDDPHGSLINFKLQVLTQFNGFVALSNDVIVIHLYDAITNSAISTQSYGSAEKYARLQYLLPSDQLLDAIVIECLEK